MPLKNYTEKLIYILPIFFSISIGSTIALALVRWLFFIEFPVVEIKEEVWHIWIPLIFPWIPILLWLRKRLKILIFKKRTDNRRQIFYYITWLMMSGMLISSQMYLSTASGTLEKVNSPTEIKTKDKAQYYILKHFFVPKNIGKYYIDISVSGKHNNNLDLTAYFVVPVVADSLKIINTIPKVWCCIQFKKTVSNNLSANEKEKEFNNFEQKCIKKAGTFDTKSITYFTNIPVSVRREGYLKAISPIINKHPEKKYTLIEGNTEPFEERNGNKLQWFFSILFIGTSLFMLALIWPKLSYTRLKEKKTEIKPEEDDIIEMFKYLIPKGSHFISSIILDINLLVYFIMLLCGINPIHPDTVDLLNWGGNFRPYINDSQWWRLITSMFLHGGVEHLLLNIAGLVMASFFVEPIFGRSRYAVIYILSGICGSVTSVLWHTNSVAVGASGAIFGLYGALLALALTNKLPKDIKRFMLILMGGYVAINLVLGLVGNTDNAAHIGGLLGGAAFGMLLYRKKEENLEKL